MLSSFSNSSFGFRFYKLVADVVVALLHPFDGLDILGRPDIVFSTTELTTSTASVTDYQFGTTTDTIVSGIFTVTASIAQQSTYSAGNAFWGGDGIENWSTGQTSGGVYSKSVSDNFVYIGTRTTIANGID